MASLAFGGRMMTMLAASPDSLLQFKVNSIRKFKWSLFLSSLYSWCSLVFGSYWEPQNVTEICFLKCVSPCVLEQLVHLLSAHFSPQDRKSISTVCPGASNCREWGRGNKLGSLSCVNDQFCRTLRKENSILCTILSRKNCHLVPTNGSLVLSCKWRLME